MKDDKSSVVIGGDAVKMSVVTDGDDDSNDCDAVGGVKISMLL
jgi:hypothetical protein